MCTVLKFIAEETASTAIALMTTAFLGGLAWLVTLRHRSNCLRRLLSNPERSFILYYRGAEDTSQKKTLHFLPGGTIRKPNGNEHFWRIRFGVLELRSSGQKVYSKFRWERKEGRLVHSNDPALPSVMGQYIVPSFIPAASQPAMYLQGQ